MKKALILAATVAPLCLWAQEPSQTGTKGFFWPWPESSIAAPEALTNPTGNEDFLETLGPLTNTQGRPDRIRPSSPLIGLYFTDLRCGPCRAFTPQLINIARSNPGLQIVVVSRDRTQEDYKALRAKNPWPAVPYESAARRALFEKYAISGVPTLLLFSRKGELLEKRGRFVAQDPKALRQLIQQARRL